MVEEWRTVVDDEGQVRENYEVSNTGKVRNVKKGNLLKGNDNGNGYKAVFLGRHVKDGRRVRFYIHQLVAFAFPDLIPNDDPINKTQLNHRNEIRHDNVWTNLEWVSPSQNLNYGSHNERVSKSKKGKGIGSDNPNAKEVICLETKQVFGCAKDGEKWCGVKGVTHCCRGETSSCGGYHWMFYDDYIKVSEEEINNILKIKPHMSKRKVVCVETQEVFNSTTDACKWCNLKQPNSIRVCCENVNRTAGGYHWRFYNN